MTETALSNEEHAQIRRLELASILEAITLVVLVGVAVPLKHLAGWPTGSRLLGPLHGLAFLFYLWTVVQTAAGGGWRGRDVARLVLVAFIPFAGFANLRWLRRRRHLLNGREAAA